MKKIDKLLVVSFLPPFIVSFFVAVFVLVMQMMWLYIDDIAGKGVSFIHLMEMIGYLAIRLIPQALPVAVLISSVLVFGGLAERYELPSIKSAGVSLLRILRPMLWISILVALFSMLCSEYFIPAANKKFMTRLYDIRKKKPGLSLEEGVFNDDFKDLVIYMHKLDKNKRDLEDVLIYKTVRSRPDFLHLITAKRGQMFLSDDGSQFVMQLYEGIQYEDLPSSSTTKYPMTKVHFKEWTKVLDLSEFELKPSDSDLFSSHQATMTSTELIDRIDSLAYDQLKERDKLLYDYAGILPVRRDSVLIKQMQYREPELAQRYALEGRGKSPASKVIKVKGTLQRQKEQDRETLMRYDTLLEQADTSILSIFAPDERNLLIKNARKKAENYQRRILSGINSIERIRDRRVKHIFELHTKFALALVCILFIFIGAPMGAIVRKGGFGYPILVAVIFFVIFILSTTSLRRLSESNDQLDPVLLAWIPSLLTLFFGVVLTYLAINDSKLSISGLIERLNRLFDF